MLTGGGVPVPLTTPVIPLEVKVDPDKPCGTRGNSLRVGNLTGGRGAVQAGGPIVTTNLNRRVRLTNGIIHMERRVRAIEGGRDLDQRGAGGAVRDALTGRIARLVGGAIGVRVAKTVIDANSRGVANAVRATVAIDRALVHTQVIRVADTPTGALAVRRTIVRISHALTTGANLADSTVAVDRALVNASVTGADTPTRALGGARAVVRVVDTHVGGAKLASGAISVGAALVSTSASIADQTSGAVAVDHTLGLTRAAHTNIDTSAVAVARTLIVAGVTRANHGLRAIRVAGAVVRVVDAHVGGAELARATVGVASTVVGVDHALVPVVAELACAAVGVFDALDIERNALSPDALLLRGAVGVAHALDVVDTDVVRADHSVATVGVFDALDVVDAVAVLADLAAGTPTVDSASGLALMERAHFADSAVRIGATAGEAVAVRAVLGSQALSIGRAHFHIFADVVGTNLRITTVGV